MQRLEKTTKEVQTDFLSHIRMLTRYWEQNGNTTMDKLNGLAFSILVALDGEASTLPGFIVATRPHEDDKKWNIERGLNYYPENHEVEDIIKGNIAGSLHDNFYK